VPGDAVPDRPDTTAQRDRYRKTGTFVDQHCDALSRGSSAAAPGFLRRSSNRHRRLRLRRWAAPTDASALETENLLGSTAGGAYA
jgi:hypothetical protein